MKSYTELHRVPRATQSYIEKSYSKLHIVQGDKQGYNILLNYTEQNYNV